MSVLTSTPLKVAPSASENLSVSTGAGAWDLGAWVPFIAATTAADTAIAGINLVDEDTWSNTQIEVHFAIGAEDAEQAIGHIRLHAPASGNGGPTQYRILFPISGIEIGSRVSIGLKANVGGFSWGLSMLYYEDLDSDQHIPYTTATLTSWPAGEDSVLLTPSATPWDDSGWGVFEAVVGDDSYVFGLAAEHPSSDVDAEIDVGQDEVALTTFRIGAWSANTGRLNTVNLPGLMPIAAGSVLGGRLRKSGMATDTVSVAFLGYRGPVEEVDEGGVIGPLLWIEWPERPQTV